MTGEIRRAIERRERQRRRDAEDSSFRAFVALLLRGVLPLLAGGAAALLGRTFGLTAISIGVLAVLASVGFHAVEPWWRRRQSSTASIPVRAHRTDRAGTRAPG